MTLHVCILGIDGSGKSTVSASLPSLLAAGTGLVVGAAGEEFRVCGPDEDHLAPKFYPQGLPFSARLAALLKKAARRMVDHRGLYPAVKVAHMLAQDVAAGALGKRHRASVVVSDGNALLSAAGRASNYLRAASDGNASESLHDPPEVEDLEAAFSYVFRGKRIPPERQARLPRLWGARLLYRVAGVFGGRAAWLPDVVVFLDLSPEAAIARISSRGRKADQHENLADLAQAREMYLKALEAFRLFRSPDAVHRIPADSVSPGETVGAVIEALRPHLSGRQVEGAASGETLGTSGREVRRMALDPRYLTRYLLLRWFRGAWREPTFMFSRLGRLFLEEGYSAGVMRAIYDRDTGQYGPLDRAFLDYPLHRAVYDRMHILTRNVEAELGQRLATPTGREIRIFTSPSGFAYDLFRPLEAIAARRPDLMSRVRLVAADLDPKGDLEGELRERAAKLGIDFKFHRMDITDEGARRGLEEAGPYDVALFVGLSAWLPKPRTLDHLRWLRRNLRPDSLLVTDSFTPEAYALSGWYAGYKASYYEPSAYRTLVDYCGFDGPGARVESGRDAINHVLINRVR